MYRGFATRRATVSRVPQRAGKRGTGATSLECYMELYVRVIHGTCDPMHGYAAMNSGIATRGAAVDRAPQCTSKGREGATITTFGCCLEFYHT